MTLHRNYIDGRCVDVPGAGRRHGLDERTTTHMTQLQT